MRIAQLAPLAESVPPVGYGGTELIVSQLTEDLVAAGHEVTLFASGDSRTNARLVSVVPRALRLDNSIPVRRWQAYDIRLLLELEQRQNEFDIVHNHMGFQALPFLDRLSCACVSTNHNPVKDYCAEIYLAYKHLPYVAISNSYKALNYPSELNYIDTVYNGIDVERFSFESATKRTHLLFLGRICEDKGTVPAIKIAKALNLPLVIAGKVDNADRTYFEEEVKPHLGSGVEYVGEVNFARKVQLYKEAIAVVYPIAFDEPFGLVMAESLIMGTPVVALDRGSVKEIIADGETGIVASSVDELIARFSELKNISAGACRERALQLFSKSRMTARYESLYQRLLNQPVRIANDLVRVAD